jgi:hypothetical protein
MVAAYANQGLQQTRTPLGNLCFKLALSGSLVLGSLTECEVGRLFSRHFASH